MAPPVVGPTDNQKLSAAGRQSSEHQTKALSQEHIGSILEAERNLTFRDVCFRHPKIVVWSFFWCMTAVAWGFEMSVNNAIIGVPAFRITYGYMLDGEPVIPAEWLSAFGVCSYCGLFFGGFVCSAVADRFGRKLGLNVGVVIATIGIIGEIFSTTRGPFLVSKLILGVGVGFYLTLGPVTCSEFAPIVLRGLSTSGINLGIGIGGLLSNSVTRGFGTRADRWAYRAPFIFQLLFSILLLAGAFLSPESPWFQVRAGRVDQARQTLKALYSSDHEVEERLATILATIQAESRI